MLLKQNSLLLSSKTKLFTSRLAPLLSPNHNSSMINLKTSYTFITPNSSKIKTDRSPQKFSSVGIQTFDNLISNCDALQKDITTVNTNIEKTILERNARLKRHKAIKHTIRNETYLKGAKRIEEKLREKKAEDEPVFLKKIKKVLIKDPIVGQNDSIIGTEDVSTREAIEYLAKNKRDFGRLLENVQEIKPKSSFKTKSVDIIVNPRETIIESLKAEEAATQIYSLTRRHSMENTQKKVETPKVIDVKPLPSVDLKKYKDRLPPLTLISVMAEKAKKEANRFFTDRKEIDNKNKTKKKKHTRIFRIDK
jgi:hypothetical protein